MLTTPGDNTKMSGIRQVESSTAAAIFRTGGSVNFTPRLLVMNDVTQNETLSGRSDRTISMRCNSLQEFCHSPVVHI